MQQYNKLIGTFVGGLIGAAVVWLNQTYGVDLSGEEETLIAVAITLVGAMLGTERSPANKAKEADPMQEIQNEK